MHLADAFSQNELKCIQGKCYHYVCSLGDKPVTFANVMPYQLSYRNTSWFVQWSQECHEKTNVAFCSMQCYVMYSSLQLHHHVSSAVRPPDLTVSGVDVLLTTELAESFKHGQMTAGGPVDTIEISIDQQAWRDIFSLCIVMEMTLFNISLCFENLFTAAQQKLAGFKLYPTFLHGIPLIPLEILFNILSCVLENLKAISNPV